MARQMTSKRMRVLETLSISIALVMILLHATSVRGQDASECEVAASGGCYDKEKSMKLKIIGIFTILVSSMIGIGLPLFSTSFPALHPDRNAATIVKILAAGVILSTGFMHVLPDSWNNLTSPCLPENPWRIYPFSTFIAMVTTVLTMMMDTVATAYFKKKGLKRMHAHCGNHDTSGGGGGGGGGGVGAVHHMQSPREGDMEMVEQTSYKGNKEIDVEYEEKQSQLLRYRIVAQVLELGIVVHSVVIGLAMGVSNNPCTIRPLVAAMCFHQLFEGMGLGGCILQADYGYKMKATMVAFFSVTTPFGIALGIGMLSFYNENSPSALIVVGVLNATSSGLLIYMALVDLLACDFMGPKLQGNIKLQLVCYFACFIGMGIMSLMAKWA
ncbi:fe(2+) transport protein 1-like [Spinacia oleracea]|uniref:Fe(2+) transport protein 1-like n=1 Tax=Spinacia oleracea TaxID=3562 RepID=A0A9R0IQS2_SPIOL|nr:fe(2+) transport protein 1-like [Spinacia oleracea]